jgi:hypothetical protein
LSLSFAHFAIPIRQQGRLGIAIPVQVIGKILEDLDTRIVFHPQIFGLNAYSVEKKNKNEKAEKSTHRRN